MIENVEKIYAELKAHLEKKELPERFKGYDPFDGLNSNLFQKSPFSKSRVLRLVWLQLFKKSPVNFRNLVGIEKEHNPQALGILLTTYCSIQKLQPSDETLETINFLVDKIIDSKAKGWSGSCWGYNFDWQARAFFQPKGTPMIVPTSACFHGLIAAYEILNEKHILDEALSTFDFVLKDLNRTKLGDNYAFSYSPLDNTIVYNASLMASSLLAKVYKYTNDTEALEAAKSSVQLCVNQQKKDGSWSYGTKNFHQWIDNFHSGYNLECISEYMKYTGDKHFEENIEKGLNYYVKTFFNANGQPNYYSDAAFPVDINNPAQLIITLAKLGKLKEFHILVDRVLEWTFDNMLSKKGFFYYQKNKLYTIKIDYLRWSQAWMLYALTTYISYANDK